MLFKKIRSAAHASYARMLADGRGVGPMCLLKTGEGTSNSHIALNEMSNTGNNLRVILVITDKIVRY